MAAAMTCSRAGGQVRLFEQFPKFSEVGAGIQLGPNVVKLLHHWGLKKHLAHAAAFPDRLQVRDAVSGGELAALRLGASAIKRYGAPYATIHRADLHALLLRELVQNHSVQLNVDSAIDGFEQDEDRVTVRLADGREAHGEFMVGADGLWSNVRRHLLNDGKTVGIGHLAYRAQIPQSSMPERLRSQHVTAWLGPDMHVVQYPVRSGEWLNVVAIVHGHMPGDAEYWDHNANAARLRRHMSASCGPLRELINSIDYWRLWAISARNPIRGPRELAQGRVALLGDAAHPMPPYLAQGAGMAIEDAEAMGRALEGRWDNVPDALKQYAAKRWRRNARVQSVAFRNGRIFHATGLVRWGRDTALKIMGGRLLDAPWLYRGLT